MVFVRQIVATASTRRALQNPQAKASNMFHVLVFPLHCSLAQRHVSRAGAFTHDILHSVEKRAFGEQVRAAFF